MVLFRGFLSINRHATRIFPGQGRISKKAHYQGEGTRIHETTSVIRIRFFVVSGNNVTD